MTRHDALKIATNKLRTLLHGETPLEELLAERHQQYPTDLFENVAIILFAGAILFAPVVALVAGTVSLLGRIWWPRSHIMKRRNTVDDRESQWGYREIAWAMV